MPHSSRLRIVVTGLIAQHPDLGGVAWDYLQYPVGLHRLGHDVYYVEDSGEWPYLLSPGDGPDPWVAADCRRNVEHLQRCLDRFGMTGRWAYRNAIDEQWYGMTDQARQEVLATADVLLNVSGSVENPDRLAGPQVRIYLDSDPAFTQVKYLRSRAGIDAPDFAARVDAHDRFFSFGETLPGSTPSTGHEWLATRQPVLLDAWHPARRPRDVFSTVLSWASYPPLEFQGRAYGQKDAEFRTYVDLPGRVGATLEVALNNLMHHDWELEPEVDAADVLAGSGWQVVDAGRHCADVDTYRDYITSSLAEWSIAKHGYVAGATGWFSGRSACYLAAGRPVVVQDTGFTGVLPTGEGIVAFRTQDDAVAGIESVRGDYSRHAAAAREIAREHFSADRVLPALLANVATGSAATPHSSLAASVTAATAAAQR